MSGGADAAAAAAGAVAVDPAGDAPTDPSASGKKARTPKSRLSCVVPSLRSAILRKYRNLVVRKLRRAVERCARARREATVILNVAVLRASKAQLEELARRVRDAKLAGRKTAQVFRDLAYAAIDCVVCYRDGRKKEGAQVPDEFTVSRKAAAKRLGDFWALIYRASEDLYEAQATKRVEMTSELGAIMGKRLAANLQVSLARSVLSGESRLVRWLLQREGEAGDAKEWNRLHHALVQILQGINEWHDLNWGEILSLPKYKEARERVRAGIELAIREKPFTSGREAQISSLLREKRRWAKSDKRRKKHTDKEIRAAVEEGRFREIAEDFPETAALESRGELRCPAPTDGEHTIKGFGAIEYLSYVRFLKQQADLCLAEAKTSKRKAPMKPTSILPLAHAGPKFLELDSRALKEVVGGEHPGLENCDRDEMLSKVLRNSRALTGKGAKIKSVRTDGASIVLVRTFEDPPVRPHFNADFYSLPNIDSQKRRLEESWGTQAHPLPAGLIDSKPLSEWSGTCSTDQCAKALGRKVLGPHAGMPKKASDRQKWQASLREAVTEISHVPPPEGGAGSSDAAAAGPSKGEPSLSFDLVAIDPGKQSPVTSVEIQGATLAEIAPLVQALKGAQGGDDPLHRYTSEDLERHLLAPGAQSQLQGSAHRNLKGQDAFTRVDNRWMRRTGADRVFAAQSRLVEMLGGGLMGGDPEAMLIMCALERRSWLFERAVNEFNPEGRLSLKDFVRELIKKAARKPNPKGGDPLRKYYFGGNWKHARDKRRARFVRARHEAVTANRLARRTHDLSDVPLSRTKEVRAQVQRRWKQNPPDGVRWEDRFAAKAARAKVEWELRRARAAAWAQWKKDKGSPEDLAEALASQDAAFRQELLDARAAERAAMCRLNRAFAEARREVADAASARADRLTPAQRNRKVRRAQIREIMKELEDRKAGKGRLTIVFVGDCSRKPGVKGQPSATHMRIVAELARRPGVLVLFVDEFRSSKLCFLCSGEMRDVERGSRDRHCTNADCPYHTKTINRDVSACLNLLRNSIHRLLWNECAEPWRRS